MGEVRIWRERWGLVDGDDGLELILVRESEEIGRKQKAGPEYVQLDSVPDRALHPFPPFVACNYVTSAELDPPTPPFTCSTTTPNPILSSSFLRMKLYEIPLPIT